MGHTFHILFKFYVLREIKQLACKSYFIWQYLQALCRHVQGTATELHYKSAQHRNAVFVRDSFGGM